MPGPHGTFAVLVTSFFTQAAAYFAVVGVVYVTVWRWGEARFRSSRIPGPRRVDRRQIRREIGHTLGTLVAGMASAGGVLSHLGYEFLPAWILKVPLLRWTNTATFHSLHHTRSRGNFGLHSRLWDRLFGTEIADYERIFIERGQPSSRGAAAAQVS